MRRCKNKLDARTKSKARRSLRGWVAIVASMSIIGGEAIALSIAPHCEDKDGVVYLDFAVPAKGFVMAWVADWPKAVEGREYSILVDCSGAKAVVIEDDTDQIGYFSKHLDVVSALVESPKRYSLADVSQEFRARGYGAEVVTIDRSSCICQMPEDEL